MLLYKSSPSPYITDIRSKLVLKQERLCFKVNMWWGACVCRMPEQVWAERRILSAFGEAPLWKPIRVDLWASQLPSQVAGVTAESLYKTGHNSFSDYHRGSKWSWNSRPSAFKEQHTQGIYSQLNHSKDENSTTTRPPFITSDNSNLVPAQRFITLSPFLTETWCEVKTGECLLSETIGTELVQPFTSVTEWD